MRILAALLALFPLLFPLLFPSIATGQDYPSKPIRLVIPYGPGSLADVVPRLIQPALEQKLETSVTCAPFGAQAP